MSIKKIIRFLVILLLFISAKPATAQFTLGKYDTIRVGVTLTDSGLKVPTGNELPPIYLYARASAQMRKRYAEWTRLRNAVYITYPYAKTASAVMLQINRELAGVTNSKRRKAIIKSHEKELRAKFTSKLRNLSIYQGTVLMKLIYRETGNSCYEIIDEYKGDFSAIVDQGVARLFGTSLKQTYNPNGEDRAMEQIVREVQQYYGY